MTQANGDTGAMQRRATGKRMKTSRHKAVGTAGYAECFEATWEGEPQIASLGWDFGREKGFTLGSWLIIGLGKPFEG